MTAPGNGQAPSALARNESPLEFRKSLLAPACDSVAQQFAAVEGFAWFNYKEGHKAPLTPILSVGNKG